MKHRVRIALGKFNVARHDLDYMRSTTIGAGLDRRSQITPTNFDLQHGPSTRPPWRHWSRAAARGAPARDVVSAGALPPDSLARPPFCPRAIEAARRQVSIWKIMAEITCGRKNPCRVAFGQQRGVTPGLSFRAPGGSPPEALSSSPHPWVALGLLYRDRKDRYGNSAEAVSCCCPCTDFHRIPR